MLGTELEKQLLYNFLGQDFDFIKLEDVEKTDFGPQKFGHLIVLTPIQNGILKKLWVQGYSIEQKIIMPRHSVVSVGGFIGEYKDIWGNKIVSYSKNFRVDISGYRSYFLNGENGKGFFSVNLGTDSCIKVDAGATFANTSFGLLYGSAMTIGNGSSFLEGGIIRMGPFTSFSCGSNCIFGEKLWVVAGDGHSIFDIRTSKRTNYMPEMIDTNKMQIMIGDSVELGEKTTIIAGCIISNNKKVGNGQLLNKFLE